MLSDIFKVPNFIMYAEQQTGKKISDLNDSEKERLYKEYTNWKTTDGRGAADRRAGRLPQGPGHPHGAAGHESPGHRRG